MLVARLCGLWIALMTLKETDHLSLPGRDGVRVADVDLALLWRGRNDGFFDLGRLRCGGHRSRQLVVGGLDLFRTCLRWQRRHRDFGILGWCQVWLFLLDLGDFADFLRFLLDLLDRLRTGLRLHLLGPGWGWLRVGWRHRHWGEIDHQRSGRIGVIVDCVPMHERCRNAAMRQHHHKAADDPARQLAARVEEKSHCGPGGFSRPTSETLR